MINGSLSYNLKEMRRYPGLTAQIIRFTDFLKGRGFKVSHSDVHDSIRSIVEIDPSIRNDFLTTLRANLVKNDTEWDQFINLFDEFWGSSDDLLDPSLNEDDFVNQKRPEASAVSEAHAETATAMSPAESSPDRSQTFDATLYSPLSAIVEKDFNCFDRTDIPIAQEIIKKLVQPFQIQESRRMKKSKKPWNIDFPRVMRKGLKTEGLPLQLYFRAKKRKLKRLVFLIDVSGSMDRFAQFVLPFILSLRRVGSKAEVFVFSTSLVPITFFIRQMNIDQILEHIVQHVPYWSGGTKIGHSLRQFNLNQGQRLRIRRSVVVILSDGWDLGEQELLKQEMTALSRNAHTVIWLNPLAGDPDYQPLCQGMKTALPYINFLLPAGNLDSLKKAGHLITKIMMQ